MTTLIRMLLLCLLFSAATTTFAFQEEAKKATADGGKIRYLEIPITGDIGFQVVPSGLEQALARGSRRPISNAIILVINSSGGTDADALAMAKMINGVNKDVLVVAAVRRAIGPATALVLAADQLVILDPEAEGIRIQYQPPLGATPEDIAKDREAYLRLAKGNPVRAAVVNAMFDPTLPVYAWNLPDGGTDASNTKPDDIEKYLEIPPGGLADGMTAQEMKLMGLGLQAKDVESIGKLLGFEDWRRRDKSGEVLMKKAADEQVRTEEEIRRRLQRGIQRASEAKALLATVDHLESLAREEDPRRQPYQYRRSYGVVQVGGIYDWGFSGPSVMAWRENSDRAVQAWRRVIDAIDRVGALGRSARDDLQWVQGQKIPRTMQSWVPEEMAILEKSLRPLLAEGNALSQRRAWAVDQADFFARNRNMPTI